MRRNKARNRKAMPQKSKIIIPIHQGEQLLWRKDPRDGQWYRDLVEAGSR